MRACLLASACEAQDADSSDAPVWPATLECTQTADCCAVSPTALCSDEGECRSDPFCGQDPECFGSRFGECSEAPGGPPVPPQNPPSDKEPCSSIDMIEWAGLQPCVPLNAYERSLSSDLHSIWRGGPAAICSYDPTLAVVGACGQLPPGNAIYCGLDDYIAWDASFMNAQAQMHGDFAAVAILAHEWGHRNQWLLGLAGPQGPSKGLELHADCQAGVFTAITEDLGGLEPGDPCEAFDSLCKAGDQFTASWFDPTAHGTCVERVGAFERGYVGATERLGELCGADPLGAMQAICNP